MVVRFWSAKTTQVHFADYVRHFNQHVMPRLRSVDGFLEGRILSQSDEMVVQFIVETLWSSAEAIHEFAGSDADVAVVAEEALDLLTSYDRRVRHYELEFREETRAIPAAAK